MRTVAAFGLEEHFKALYDAGVRATEAADRKANLYKSMCLGAIFVILVLVYALGWYAGTRMVISVLRDSDGDDLSMGARVLTVFFCCMGAAFALGQIGPNITALSQAAGSLESILEMTKKASKADPWAESGLVCSEPFLGVL